jgi:broad specificity phosphatase PhoE
MKAGYFPAGDEPAEPISGLTLTLATEGSRVLTSPARAACETAKAIARSYEVSRAFDDLDHGRWRGQSIKYIAVREPESIAAWLSDPSAAPHGGESIAMLVERIARALEDLDPRADGQVIVVTHAIVVKAALVHVLGLPLVALFRMDLTPLSSTELDYDGGWSVHPVPELRGPSQAPSKHHL